MVSLYAISIGSLLLLVLLIVLVRTWMRARANRRLRKAVQDLYAALDTVYHLTSGRLDIVQSCLHSWKGERARLTEDEDLF